MASQTHHPYFLLIPLMSQSHLIPFTQTAKLLAANGVSVTIVLTPLNAARLNMVIDHAKALNLKIQFHLIPFPSAEVGLPEGCENMDTIPSPQYQPLFFVASNMLKEPLEKWLSELETLPTCIVSDICLLGQQTLHRSSRYRGLSSTESLASPSCAHKPLAIPISKVHENVTSMSKPFVVADLPDKIEFTKTQLPKTISQDSKAWKSAVDQFKATELSLLPSVLALSCGFCLVVKLCLPNLAFDGCSLY
ncbi:UDP-glycosyltransferase 73C3 [Spatholobus suberectus]|nr:UDP-glycosyltransferase 73C3 [Spatholobus suberectus]